MILKRIAEHQYCQVRNIKVIERLTRDEPAGAVGEGYYVLHPATNRSLVMEDESPVTSFIVHDRLVMPFSEIDRIVADLDLDEGDKVLRPKVLKIKSDLMHLRSKNFPFHQQRGESVLSRDDVYEIGGEFCNSRLSFKNLEDVYVAKGKELLDATVGYYGPKYMLSYIREVGLTIASEEGKIKFDRRSDQYYSPEDEAFIYACHLLEELTEYQVESSEEVLQFLTEEHRAIVTELEKLYRSEVEEDRI